MDFDIKNELEGILTDLKGVKQLLDMLADCASADMTSLDNYHQGILLISRLCGVTYDQLENLWDRMTPYE